MHIETAAERNVRVQQSFPKTQVAFRVCFPIICALVFSSCGGSGTTVGPTPENATPGQANTSPPPGASTTPTSGGAKSPLPGSSSMPVSSMATPSPSPSPVSGISGAVTTTSGTFIGSTTSGIAEFKGIPYAAPPIGSLRWKPPQPVVPASTLQSATSFGKACINAPAVTAPVAQVVLEPPVTDTSEACLFLNVYAPTPLSGKKPVVVWIHGGAYNVGYGDVYDGSYYAKNGIVAVTLNYRLGIFGFFPHPGLDAESSYNSSGDQGLLDQVAALQWVQKNIAAFGGDPTNVTIEGESAGAGSVGSILTSPLTKGLYHRAILESTYALLHPQPTHAQAETYFASAFPLYSQSIASLRSMSTNAIEAMAPQNKILGDGTTNLYDPTYYGPIIDNHYQTDSSLHLWRNHQFTVTDILIGTCDNEGYIFTSEPTFGTGYPQYETNPTFQAYLQQQYGTLGTQALADYPVSAPQDANTQLGYAFGDTWFQYGTRYIARAEVAAGANVYRYVLTRQPSGSITPETHGCEVNFVFPGSAINSTPTDTGIPTYEALFQDTFSRFIKTGNPNGGVVNNWPLFGTDDGYLNIANAGNIPMTEYRQAPIDLVDDYSNANLP